MTIGKEEETRVKGWDVINFGLVDNFFSTRQDPGKIPSVDFKTEFWYSRDLSGNRLKEGDGGVTGKQGVVRERGRNRDTRHVCRLLVDTLGPRNCPLTRRGKVDTRIHQTSRVLD